MSKIFSDDEVKYLKQILSSLPLDEYLAKAKQQQYAQGLRGEVESEWLSNFLANAYKSVENDTNIGSAFLVNEATGEPHTVDTVVEFYKGAIGLDKLLEKSASLDIPLSKKQAEDIQKKNLEVNLSQFKDKIYEHTSNYISSHHGIADIPAILYDLREIFGDDIIFKMEEELTDFIKNKRLEYGYSGEKDPKYKNSPFALKVDNNKADADNNIFYNIKENGGSSKG